MRHPPGRVHLDASAAEDRWSGGLRPAGERSQPRHELGEREGLWQVVVRAEVQAVDPVLDGGRRGQHEDPAARALLHQLGTDVVTADPGQIPVQHDHVVAVDQGALQPGVTVEGKVHRHLLTPKADANSLRELAVVLDHQHPHATTSPLPGCRAGCSRFSARLLWAS